MELILIIAVFALIYFIFKLLGDSRTKDTALPFEYWLSQYENASYNKKALMASIAIYQAFHIVSEASDGNVYFDVAEKKITALSITDRRELVDRLINVRLSMQNEETINEILKMQTRVALATLVLDWTRSTNLNPLDFITPTHY